VALLVGVLLALAVGLMATAVASEIGPVTARLYNFAGGGGAFHRQDGVVPMIHVPDVRATAEWFERLKDRVEIVEPLHDTFYGMRESFIRDLNCFWINFGQPTDQAKVGETGRS